MTTPQKQNALQAYQVVLYERALHPELFALRARRVVSQGQWELEAWVMQGQHLLRFEHGPVCASELVTDQEAGLPTTGAVAAFLCAGERDYERSFTGASGVPMENGAAEGNGLAPDGAVHVTNGVLRGESRRGRGACVVYMLTVQTESLSENLYAATCDEMTAHAEEHGSLLHAWTEDAGRGMSLIDVQRYAHEVHAQAYHLLPTGGIVIRTQTIFEHA